MRSQFQVDLQFFEVSTPLFVGKRRRCYIILEVEDVAQNHNEEVFGSHHLILPPLQEDNILVISPMVCTQLGPDSDPYNQDSSTGSNEDSHISSLFNNGLSKQGNETQYVSGFESLFLKQEIDSDCEPERPSDTQLYVKCDSAEQEKRELKKELRVFNSALLKILPTEKQYKCMVCCKNFSNRFHLSRHMKIHTGEKPYECNICKKAFAQKSSLFVHQRIHTGEKPYVCDVCKKSFSATSHLSVHRRIHTGEKPYKCDTCTKAFSAVSQLAVHRRTHTGERPYECDICRKTFTTRCNLSAHKKIHTGEKHYVCELCMKAFSRSSNLNVHQKNSCPGKGLSV
ncbi:hypothetical protein QYM36_009809 [Artemia franciscana]|uniref:C2H2-type domain-containing protein n=1 Tax=Artemia franciscana TaxID=6661 RepID=A0AA88LB61_ARTSF|nr:hypothetical protein QYM36_009809 [Artemia franciscana]